MSQLLSSTPPFIESHCLLALSPKDPSVSNPSTINPPKLVQIVDPTHLLNLEYSGEYRDEKVDKIAQMSSAGHGSSASVAAATSVPVGRWNRVHVRDSSTTTIEVFLPEG